MSAVLTNLRTGAIVWSGDATETSNVDKRDVDSVVAEMSRAVQANIDRLVGDMEQQISGVEVSAR
jgi:hypothetical protein